MPKQVKFFYDTEFKEDGKTVDLISIGIVRYDTGEKFYAVSTEFDTARVAADPWLMRNVMSSIDYEEFLDADPITGKPFKNFEVTDPAAMTREQIRDGIMEFTDGTWPDFWAWYGSYDHVALAQLWGRMVDLPKRMPFFTSDIKQLHKLAGGQVELPKQPEGLHNALADAEHSVVRYEFLVEFLKNKGIELP
jgi:hypothetical protein